MVGNLTQNGAKLKRIFIEPKLPEGLAPLTELSQNLWWSWNHDAIDLFKSIDPEKYEAVGYSPGALLDELNVEKARELLDNKDFMTRMKRVHAEFRAYIDKAPAKTGPEIAYFCMEYGLHQSIRLYSGGLGVLAGDYLKEVSDRNFNLIAVGLLYRYGYFQQGISLNGEQIHHFEPAKFTQLPLQPVRDKRGEWIKIQVNLAGRTVWAKVWVLPVGRVSLYLLDTDIDDNRWEDRSITHQLYGGDNENRLRQEILLGIGGLRALKAMDLNPDIYHLNEGHASLLGLERISNYMKDKGLSYDEALEVVRGTQLFTTHTPVPAGHDTFSETLLREYLYDYTYALDIAWEDLVALGRIERDNAAELFNVSHLAIRTSQEINGVSRLHGEVSQKMFLELNPDYSYTESNIGYVTNSVHFPTWVAREWLELYQKDLGKDILQDQGNKKLWSKIHAVPAEKIMDIRRMLKKRLLDWVRHSLQSDLTRRGENPRSTFEIINSLRDDALVLGFARRFATYKRATLLFSNEKRLAEIVNNTDRPVIFLFAGKAHPADKAGQEFIRLIYNTTKNPLFKGKVIFLENYSMEMAKLLVQGVDIWLNNPTRPKEASGTSGMKAVMNGVMNFSVLDGWWCEGYKPGAGWALPEKETFHDAGLQNELDAETIYNILENDIVPTYYEQDANGISERWVSHIKKTIAEIAPEFVMGRMLDDYESRFYSKLWAHSQKLKKGDYRAVRELVEWKSRIRRAWDAIELVEMDVPDTYNHSLPLGEQLKASVTLNIQHLKAEDLGMEVVFYKRLSETELELITAYPMQLKVQKEALATYTCDVSPHTAGVFEFGFRLYPKHPMLVHRQDFGLVRWL
ncbi:MAG: alpha-glucan family phosphorylase [Lewinellaceae bacterium]|jgi:starch phosphorylase|nr:alpha-glucan family phosphorylase [Lewinellaceae bacterium]